MRRFSFFIPFVLMLAMALPGCGGGAGKGGQEGQLGGKIYKQGTDELIKSDVTVSIDGKSIATASGEYLFTALSPGDKGLTAQAVGYKPYTATVTIKKGANTHDIYMEKAPPSSLGGEIYNKITEKLITKNVSVTLDDQTIVTANGEFLFTGLTAGEKTLTAQADGYEIYTATVTIGSGETATHDIYMKRPGLVAHYKFNGDATDSSGNGYDGTVYDAASVPGRFGEADKAYYFDGEDDYIEVECQSFINKPERNEISVAAWLKLTTNPGATLALYANEFVIYQTQQKLSFSIVTTAQDLVEIEEVPYNQWVHFVGTYDGTNITVYINGTANKESKIHEEPGSIRYLSRNLVFGRNIVSSYYWKGTIDDFQIYDRVLTAEEINELAGHRPVVMSGQ